MNIWWKGIEYESIEKCSAVVSENSADISSAINGSYGAQVYQVEYLIKTNAAWETVFFRITSMINGKSDRLEMASDGKGNWQFNGEPIPKYQGCIDIDIPLTPFTNTLPINRLKLKCGASAQIRVLYLDLLEDKISAVYQKYTRLSKDMYHYENVPNDFEATITVDDRGLVVDYPTLFVRS